VAALLHQPGDQQAGASRSSDYQNWLLLGHETPPNDTAYVLAR
jgi:hypothetical protein